MNERDKAMKSVEEWRKEELSKGKRDYFRLIVRTALVVAGLGLLLAGCGLFVRFGLWSSMVYSGSVMVVVSSLVLLLLSASED